MFETKKTEDLNQAECGTCLKVWNETKNTCQEYEDKISFGFERVA